MKKRASSPLYHRIRQILESARASAARSVNTAQVVANWLIGHEIVEEEQKGAKRAQYGKGLLRDLSSKLTKDFGHGFSVNNLEHFRHFYLEFPRLIDVQISHAVRGKLGITRARGPSGIHHLLPVKSHASRGKSDALRRELQSEILASESEIFLSRGHSWKPGLLHPNISWTHYRTLLRVEAKEARAFYEIETLKNNWSARELERQINSLLYERLAKSRDKKGLLRLATKGHEIQHPADIFKDPVVIEFLGLPESPRLAESNLEQALIGDIQAFMLELGKGFAFVSRQKRITLDGDHFYIDLVFYHTVLKCYVLIDVKIGKLTHQDLGQLQLYANYFDQERRTPGDGPTLGLILCTDKNDAVVRYTLGREQAKKIFASRYKLNLPTEAELKAEIRRELSVLRKEGAGA